MLLLGFLCVFSVSPMVISTLSSEREIYFPPQEPVIEPPCKAYDGQQGICRLLVQCATFLTEIAQLSRSPCTITEEQQGVCCPPTKKPTKDPTTIVPKPPVLRAIIFPDVTTNDINNACQKSIEIVNRKIEFAEDLVQRKVVALPGSPVFWHNRLFETTDEIFQKGKNATIVLEASKDLMNQFDLSKEQVEQGLPTFSVLDTIISSTCPPSPQCPTPDHRYRTLDGSCNNLRHKDWGKTGIAFTRMVLPEYEDGLLSFRLATDKTPLPSPRFVSSMIAPPKHEVYNNLTILIWQWGQFLDHDITHTPISKGANKADISCCRGGAKRPESDLHPECIPIEIPSNDPFFAEFNQGCMEFVRSMPSIRPECKFGSREQMNQITSYIDASNVYGSTEDEAIKLRTFKGGLLRVTNQNGRELLPGADKTIGCFSRSVQQQCFVAGDTRVNEQHDLAVMHTVWARQHNKLVRALAKINPGWDDETLYQEGRRIVAAQMQHITYNEYLPIVLGRHFMEEFGLLPLKKGYFHGYRPDVDATIMNSFATAAFRYGHTLITDTIQGFGKFGMMNENMEISKSQFFPFSLYEPQTLDSLIRGLTLQQSQKFDRFFSEQLTNKLFAQHRNFGMDLVAMNIQRGRDHGLAPYVKWREVCGLPPLNAWNDLRRDMDDDVIRQLQKVYSSVQDIDLFVGGVSEKIIKGSVVGPTFLCILGRQFIKLKIGDRFYYENGKPIGPDGLEDSSIPIISFTEPQLTEIRRTSLARILCDNSDNVEMMQPLVFSTAHLANMRALCVSNRLIPKLSLDPWHDSKASLK